MTLTEKLTSQITSIYSAADFNDSLEALEALEKIANNKGMDEQKKTSFNRNFYTFLRDIETTFEEELILPTSKGISYLAALEATDRERIDIMGDEYKFSFKLIDGSERFQPAWNPETGKTRFPSQFLFFVRVVLMNGFDKIGAAA